MIRKYDAIVVGGGLAGLTSAAYLSRYGFRTLVCESRHKAGGLVNTFRHQGFAFDGGIRAFENSGIVIPMLKDLGIDIELIKNQVVIGIGDERVELSSKESLEEYAEMLIRIFPDYAADISSIKKEIRKVMGYMDVLYGIDNPLFIQNMDLGYLKKTLLPWFIKYQKNIGKASRLNEPIQSYLSRFTNNRSLIDMIIQHFFKQTPTFFALSYFSLYLDYSYPVGGTGVLAEKIMNYIQSAGGDIKTDAAVVQVDAGEHQLQLANGEVYKYGKLVWAANQKTLYSITKGSDTSGFKKQQVLAGQSKGGDSILTVFLGIDQAADYFKERCGAHMFYTPVTRGLSSLADWEEVIDGSQNDLYKWLGDYLDLTTFEISCPVIRDASLAPEGKTGLIVSTLLDYNLAKHFSETGDYEPFKEFCIQKVISILGSSLLKDIQHKILFSLCATPLTIERETANSEGAITGWSFTNQLVPSENRFKKITKAVFTPIPDVYQCGQWTFSPSGLPVSILTGKVAADQVKKSGLPSVKKQSPG